MKRVGLWAAIGIGIFLTVGLIIVEQGYAEDSSTVTRQDAAVEASRGLIGAWLVTASRPTGVGKNLLTFSSDGTFFRSGDTHPVYSGGHGAWNRVGDREFDATYIAFLFDENGKWIGSNKVRIHITQGPGDNEFTAATKSSRRDLQDNEISTAEGRLAGTRIQVEPF
jgi:hypothetical protein